MGGLLGPQCLLADGKGDSGAECRAGGKEDEWVASPHPSGQARGPRENSGHADKSPSLAEPLCSQERWESKGWVSQHLWEGQTTHATV